MPFTDQLKVDTPEQITLELPLSGVGSRFFALFLDTVLQFVLYVVVFLALAFAVPAGLERYLNWIPRTVAPALVILFLFCIYWGYFAFFEIIWKGQTPGKRWLKIRVIHESGRPVNAYEAIGRNLLRAIDSLPGVYAVGLICMMIDRKNRRVGDFIAGTVVVHDRKSEELRPDWNISREPVAVSPNLAQVTAEELMLIESYLQRRSNLDFAVRDRTAYQIAARMTAKTGIERNPDQSLDEFLEALARQARDAMRFR
jgi:uncharacterized RDD family membrane protein YckC